MTQKILPCPFCGKRCGVFYYYELGHPAKVKCHSCGYSTPQFKTDDEAIAAHNTVSRNNAAAPELAKRRRKDPEYTAQQLAAAHNVPLVEPGRLDPVHLPADHPDRGTAETGPI